MTVGIVITIYKDLESLKIIINAIKNQMVLPTEIIIAEDNESEEIKDFVLKINIPNVSIKHTYQKDEGWQRNKSTNNALRIAQSEYLIFLDGDCIPHSKLVYAHKLLSKDNTLLCGRRVYLGPTFSKLLRKKIIQISKFEKNYIKDIFDITKDTRHYEEGLYFDPKGFFYNLLKKVLRKKTWLIGCHWSVWRNDLLKINGFDEDFNMPLYGEDVDVERRLRGIGVKIESCRNAAIVYHLHHEKVFNSNEEVNDYKIPYDLMQSKKDQFICKNGVEKL